jgi:hypothetical protein
LNHHHHHHITVIILNLPIDFIDLLTAFENFDQTYNISKVSD